MKKMSLFLLYVLMLGAAAGNLSGCKTNTGGYGGLLPLLAGMIGSTENHGIEVKYNSFLVVPPGGSYDCGDIADTRVGYMTFRITNISSGTIVISSIDILSGDSDDFEIYTELLSSSLSPNAFTVFSVHFKPTSIGKKSVTVGINYAPSEGPFIITASGNAVGCIDLDGDGYGDGTECLGWDCEDLDATRNPEAQELCGNYVDEDCNGEVDEEGCIGCNDMDEDGYGSGTTCLGPDCNDFDPTVYFGAPELCDGEDNDCDEDVDEGCPMP